MRTSVLLSIKPIFMHKIFQGIKQYEFRRSIFKNRDVVTVIVYASSPICKVVGEFEIKDILELEKELLWHNTKDYSGITKEYFDSYFRDRNIGYAIKIGKTRLYSTPLELSKDFNVKRPPQSFMYVLA
jgi:predicted transcriptional regulator